MTEQQALVRSFGSSEARRLTDELKRDAQTLWQRLIELYEGGAHEVLGYANWHDYCREEFGFGQGHSYRLLRAGRVAGAIAHLGNGGSPNEAQARELVPLLEDEDALVDVWTDLREKHGERLTAEKIRSAVNRKLEPRERPVIEQPASGNEHRDREACPYCGGKGWMRANVARKKEA